jgi:hypothetical protein
MDCGAALSADPCVLWAIRTSHRCADRTGMASSKKTGLEPAAPPCKGAGAAPMPPENRELNANPFWHVTGTEWQKQPLIRVLRQRLLRMAVAEGFESSEAVICQMPTRSDSGGQMGL